MRRHHTFGPKRLVIIEGMIYLALAMILSRALIIQLFSPSESTLKQMASRQYSSHITLGNYRGTIYDRRQSPLALSVQKPSLALNPRVFDPRPEEMEFISQTLELSKDTLRVIASKDSYFAWLARHTTFEKAQAILKQKIPGIYELREPGRYYPTGAASSHIIGKVNIDNHGLFAMERLFNQELAGDAGKVYAVRDGKGQLIFEDFRNITVQQPGMNIHLSIDGAIQEIAYEELKLGLELAGAASGFVLVGDPYSGAILASVSLPSYNPNQKLITNIEHTRNKPSADLFEPGSIMKPFVVAEALKHHLTTFYTPYFFSLAGVLRFRGGRIRDDHPKKILTTSEILVHSSNIGTFYLARKLQKQALYDLMSAIGVGGQLSIWGLGGIPRGGLTTPDTWHPTRFANISFGQGFSMNGLQILRAYNVIASGGKLSDLHLVQKITNPDGTGHRYRSIEQSHTLYDAQVMSDVSRSLHEVTQTGTGRAAASRLYTVAGKTGTSEKFDREARAYSKDRRIASFAGFAPYSDPKITIVVVVDEPTEKPYYGGKWAAPVFRRIVDRTLPYLNVPFDMSHAHATLADPTAPPSALPSIKPKNQSSALYQ